MKKILITGSSGFIGKHLLAKIDKTFEIACLQSDLRDHLKVKLEVLTFDPDLVIHLAARTEVEQSFYEQTVFSDINYVGTVNLIESMLLCKKIPKLLFASTMEVYGWQPVSDFIKNNNCLIVFRYLTQTTQLHILMHRMQWQNMLAKNT